MSANSHLARLSPRRVARPSLSAAIELLKPITWFPPMWAYGCGVVSAGGLAVADPVIVALGVVLAGPLVCGASQAVNDWYDRHVDAINEPHRPIPSGRMPGRSGLWLAIGWTALSAVVGLSLGPWVAAATALGLVMAWAYSAPPLRLKSNGWWGNAAVGLCYEGLPWFTGAAAVLGGLPDGRIVLVALLYSFGAHGIMTINDYKSLDGDRAMGVRSLPEQLGPERAARLACVVMAVPQAVVVALLIAWGSSLHAAIVAALLLVQFALMRRWMAEPRARAPWYNATGVLLYVLGMLATAFALRDLAIGAGA